MSRLSRSLIGVLLTIPMLGASTAGAQSYAFGFAPRMGDPDVEATLAAADALATGDLEGFIDDLVQIYAAPRVEVRELIIERHYPPDYVWLAAATSHSLGQDWNQVFPVFEQHRGQGWGAIAKELGIKPGSAEFHALKRDLGRHPGHGKANKPTKGGPPPGKGKGQGKGQGKDKGKQK